MSINDFQILQKLGDGSYSQVYKVRRLEDNQQYALKKVKMLKLSDREKENALNEVRILASLKHKNVVQYKQAFFDEPSSSLWYYFFIFICNLVSSWNMLTMVTSSKRFVSTNNSKHS